MGVTSSQFTRHNRHSSNMSDTLFLLDMLRFANQEKLRARKDEMIQSMAMEQKRKTEEAKKFGHATVSNHGGFVGVDQLSKHSNQGAKQQNFQQKRDKENRLEESKPQSMNQDSEMFILGLLKEQRQEEYNRDRENQISEKSVGCVSDRRCMEKFEN